MKTIEDNFWSKRFWQTAIAVTGLVSALIGIYSFIFQGRNQQLDFEILTNTNVLDINADITKLDITYDRSSLKSNNQSLRVVNLRIRNTGDEGILKSFYDNNDPLGVMITKGRIIEKPELVSTSNEYINKNLTIRFDSLGKLTFSDIILEPNDFYTVKLLLLHVTKEIPEIHATGKIAGIQQINVVSLVQDAKEEKSFWQKTFEGTLLMQLTRGLAYTIAVIGIIVIIALSSDRISSYRKKQRRIHMIKNFKKQKNYDYNRMDDAIFTRFEKNGTENLLRYQNLLKDDNRLNQKYNNWINKLKRNVEDEISEFGSELILNDKFFSNHSEWTIFNEMINDGLAIKDKDKLVANQPMRRTLNLFIDYLKEIGHYIPGERQFYGGSTTSIENS